MTAYKIAMTPLSDDNDDVDDDDDGRIIKKR